MRFTPGIVCTCHYFYIQFILTRRILFIPNYSIYISVGAYSAETTIMIRPWCMIDKFMWLIWSVDSVGLILVQYDWVIDHTDACRHCAVLHTYDLPSFTLCCSHPTLSTLPYGPHGEILLTMPQAHEIWHHGNQLHWIKSSESVGTAVQCLNSSETEGTEWSVSHSFWLAVLTSSL